MEDIIFRKDAINACGEMPEVLAENDEFSRGMKFQWGMDVSAIEHLPSTQQEIIRCKDCKYVTRWRSKESARKFGQVYECRRGVFAVPKPDDFCSKAERRTDE